MDTKNQPPKNRTLLIVGVVLMVLIAAFGASKLSFFTKEASAKAPMSAVVKLSADKDSFGESDEVIIHVTITNPNSYPIKILKWFTPVNELERSLFTITRNGETVPYVGRMIKRAEPTENDYITIEAGASLTSDVNLARYYNLSSSDNYEVVYDVTSLQLYVEKEIGALNDGRLNSNTLKMFITGRPVSRP